MAGTSPPINIGGEEFKPRKGVKLSEINDADLVANPPTPNGTEPSEMMSKFQNPYREFAFDKISMPNYGNSNTALARYTGIPANKPDYISDHHFIGIMRCIDSMLRQGYSGRITGDYDTPNAR